MNDERGKSRWTARFLLRSAGIVALLVVIVMALLGAYVFDFANSARTFFVYWSIFFFFLLGVIAVAMFDAIITMAKFRKEHSRLREAFRREFGGRREPKP